MDLPQLRGHRTEILQNHPPAVEVEVQMDPPVEVQTNFPWIAAAVVQRHWVEPQQAVEVLLPLVVANCRREALGLVQHYMVDGKALHGRSD